MPNYLEAIGRTNALTEGVKAITNTAVAMRQLGLQELQANQQQAMQERQMKLLEAAGEREKIQLDQQQADLNKVTAWDRVMPSMMPTAGPETQKKITDFFESHGLIDEVSGQKVISKRNFLQGAELYKSNLTFNRAVDETHLQEIGNQITELSKQLTNPEKPPTEKEITNIGAKLNALQVERRTVLNMLNDLDQETRKAMATAQTKTDIKEPKIVEKPISDTMQRKYLFNKKTEEYDIPFGEPYPIHAPKDKKDQLTKSQSLENTNKVRDDARTVLKNVYGTTTIEGGFVVNPEKAEEYQNAVKYMPEYTDKLGADIGGILAAQRAALGNNYKIIQAKIKESIGKKIPKNKIISDLTEKKVDYRIFKELQ